jgi:hypothetical protein
MSGAVMGTILVIGMGGGEEERLLGCYW